MDNTRKIGRYGPKSLEINILINSHNSENSIKPLVTIIVLGYRNFALTTKPCLDSLVPWIQDSEIEILVVDNSSPDGSDKLTEKWCETYSQVRFLQSKTNLGYAGGMNWGAEHARGQWLFLINNDTIFPVHTMDALKRVVREAPQKVAMLGPVTNSAGNGQRLWKPDANYADWLNIGAKLHSEPTNHLMPTYRCDFFCIAIRNHVWKQLGGLDTDFGLGYYEDFDFSLRLMQAGWEQKITEDVFVLHSGSATFQASKEAKVLLRRNKELIQRKHPYACFEHTRAGNLAILRAYQELKRSNLWTSALETRLGLRLPAVSEDAPRSLFRKWNWLQKTKPIVSALKLQKRD